MSCGLNFTTRVASAATLESKCSCGALAQKDLPRGVSVTTSVAAHGNGMAAPDSGLSAHDYEVDRVVGAYSKQAWVGISARQKDKSRLIEETGASGFDLSRQADGSYKIMTPEQRAASERSRSFHFKMDRQAHIRRLDALQKNTKEMP